MEKIERKFLAHFVDAAEPGAVQTDYERLGEDLEELVVEMSAQVDKKKNILGNSSTLISSYEPSASVEPYYATKGSALGARLQKIADERPVLDKLKTTVVEVQLWTADTGDEFTAYREDAMIELVSYGGDNTGVQLPFNIHLTGNRVKGVFDISTRMFTPAAAS